jgi:hypothetical protein
MTKPAVSIISEYRSSKLNPYYARCFRVLTIRRPINFKIKRHQACSTTTFNTELKMEWHEAHLINVSGSSTWKLC